MVLMGEAHRRMKTEGKLKEDQAYNSLGTLYHCKKHIQMSLTDGKAIDNRLKKFTEL